MVHRVILVNLAALTRQKWMNSMHVKAFFEYLMDRPNEYWTNIPTDPNPVAWPVRDGVAFEDDMALRAVVPEIRPKRGRKRPDPDVGPAPATRGGGRRRPLQLTITTMARKLGQPTPKAGPRCLRTPTGPPTMQAMTICRPHLPGGRSLP